MEIISIEDPLDPDRDMLDDYLEVVFEGSITKPGTTEGRIASVRAFDDNDNDVTYKYDFDISDTSIITVNPRPLNVSSGSSSVAIDKFSGVLRNSNYTVGNNNLLSGHKIRATFTGMQEGVGRSSNYFTIEVVDERGNTIEDWEELYTVN